MTTESEQFFREQLRQAETGDAKAQLEVGLSWVKGVKNYGIDKDLEKARYWLKKASDQGNLRARVEFAVMLSRGEGGPSDSDTAVNLLIECATKDQTGYSGDNMPMHATLATMRLGLDDAKRTIYFTKGWGQMSEEQRRARLFALMR